MLAVFASVERAEQALGDLRGHGFGATRLSVIGMHDASCWSHQQPWWMRLRVQLDGMAVVSVPGIGRVVALGPIAWPTLSSTLPSMMMRAGISPRAAQTYEAALRGGQTLLLVHGSAQDALRARGVMRAAARRGAAP